MSISFNSIPVNLNTPGQFIEFDNSRAVQGSPATPNVVLIVGQRLAAGTIAEAVPIQVASKTKAETYFGHGSMLAQMVEYYKAANAFTEVWCIALDDAAASVAATGTFTFGGAATEDGSVFAYVGGERIPVAVSSGDAAAAVAILVDAAITDHLLTSNLPVNPSVATVVTTITALQKGTLGNDIDLDINYTPGEALPAGLTCAVVQMASGATDPDVADAIAVFSDKWYTTIISAYDDATNQALLEAEMLTRWGPLVMQDGMIFTSSGGSQGSLTTLGNARNSQFMNYMGSGLSPTPTWLWAAVTGAIDSGEPDPARPRQTLLLPGLKPPRAEDQFLQSERNILLGDGISTYTIGQDGKVYVERLITTYQTNPGGVPDPSYKDITTMRTLAHLRFTLRSRIALRFPRHKLASDGTNFGPGQAIVTPSLIHSEILSLFRQWESAGLVEGFDQFKTELLVLQNDNDTNRVDAILPPDLMNQFRVFAAQIQYLL